MSQWNKFSIVNNYDDFNSIIEYMTDESKKDSRKYEYEFHKQKNKTNSLLESKKTIILENTKDFIHSEINKCDSLAKDKPVTKDSQEYIINFVNTVNGLFDAFKTHDFKTDFLELAIPDCSRETSELIFSNPEELKKWVATKVAKLDIACKQYYDFSEGNRLFIDKLIDSPIIKTTLNINKQISFDLKNPEHILFQLQENKDTKHRYLELAILVSEIRSYTEIENNERVAVFLTSVIYSDILQSIPKDNQFYGELYDIKRMFFEDNISNKNIDEKYDFYKRISELSTKFSLGMNVSTYEHDAKLKNLNYHLSLSGLGISNDTVDSMTIMLFGNDLHIVNHHSTKNSTTDRSNQQAYRAFMAVKNDLNSENSLIKKTIETKFGLDIKQYNIKHSSLQIIGDGINELPTDIFANPHYQTKNVLNTLEFFADTLSYASGVHLETQLSENPTSTKDILKLFLECIRDVRRDANYNEYIEKLISSNTTENEIKGYDVILNVLHNSLEIFNEKFINKDVLNKKEIRSANTDKFSTIFGKPLFTLMAMLHSSELNDYDNEPFYSLIIKNVKQVNALAKATGVTETKEFNSLLSNIAGKYLNITDIEKAKIQGGKVNEELLQRISEIKITNLSHKFSINDIKISECVELSNLTLNQCRDLHQRIFKSGQDLGAINELKKLGGLIVSQFEDGIIPRYKGQGSRKPIGMLEDLSKLWGYSIECISKGNPPNFNVFVNSNHVDHDYSKDWNNLNRLIQFTKQGNANENSKNLEKILIILGIDLDNHDISTQLRRKNSM